MKLHIHIRHVLGHEKLMHGRTWTSCVNFYFNVAKRCIDREINILVTYARQFRHHIQILPIDPTVRLTEAWETDQKSKVTIANLSPVQNCFVKTGHSQLESYMPYMLYQMVPKIVISVGLNSPSETPRNISYRYASPTWKWLVGLSIRRSFTTNSTMPSTIITVHTAGGLCQLVLESRMLQSPC